MNLASVQTLFSGGFIAQGSLDLPRRRILALGARLQALRDASDFIARRNLLDLELRFMIFLALDYGARRLGLAISDDAARLALPLQTQSRRVNDARGDIAHLLELIKARGVGALVLGIAGGSQQSEETAARARRFAAGLLEAGQSVGLELAFFETDERYSSAQAHSELRAQGISARQSRDEGGADSIDARAAAVFLQTFLDFRRADAGDASLISSLLD